MEPERAVAWRGALFSLHELLIAALISEAFRSAYWHLSYPSAPRSAHSNDQHRIDTIEQAYQDSS